MSKNQQKPKPPDPNSSAAPADDQALVLFGQQMSMLPIELERMGLAGKVQVREIPGVVPSWKPVTKGDFLIGRCVDMRPDLGKYKTTALVFETAVPGGFRTVWLGADLKIKLHDAIGKVYSIYYDGTVDTGKGNPLRSYRVMEVIPTDELLPPSRQIEST